MSRDWTPHEFDMISKEMNYEVCPTLDMVWHLKSHNGQAQEQEIPLFTEDQKTKIKTLPKLSCIGIDFLTECIEKGVYSDEKGHQILQQLENYFSNGEDIKDKELLEKALLWYDGKLVPGRYMDDNTNEFVMYVISRIKEK